jgi:hypothetical protein
MNDPCSLTRDALTLRIEQFLTRESEIQRRDDVLTGFSSQTPLFRLHDLRNTFWLLERASHTRF